MKKLIPLVLPLVLLLSLLGGCAANLPTTVATSTAATTTAAVATTITANTAPVEFSIKINGKDFTQADCKNLPMVTVTVKKASKDGTTKDNTWTGYQVDALLKAAGVTEYQTVTVAAGDGFSADITAEEAKLATTLFGMLRVDAAADAADIPTLVVDGAGSSTWVKGIAEVTTK
jgi:hypothetical protein